ncbi:unnamed protein product [Plasmodium vivax]|uniref:(malaria parasite P. vivax) hypothetical protein n=1 Tax=Plasmodium vivax TaxID=5855 RepID=A0A8S4HHX6_PLAVI|nr:unnamed protein product [Plasmodium vivax]
MRRATFLLKLLLLAAIAAQEGLLSWQLMTSKTLVVLLDAGLLTVFLYLQVRSANNTHMYMIYVYSVVAKVTVIYYISLPRALTGHHGGAGGAASSLLPTLPLTLRPTTYADSIHVVSSAILLSIVVYILFFLVTDFDLLKVRLINLEMFFCLLIITHVSIDLLDISNFFSFVHFHFLLYHFRVVQELSLFSNPDLFAGASLDRKDLMDFYSFCLHAHQAVFILFGVLLCVNIAIHAYSLPSFSYESNKRRKVSSKGGGDVGGHPLSAPHLAHSYSCDVTMPRWSSDRKGANGGGGKDHYGHLHSGALTKRGSFPGGPPQLGWRHSISRGITGGIHGGIAEGIHGDIHGGTAEGTSSFSPATEAPLPRSKVGGDAMSCLKYISIYSFFFTDVSLFAARLFLCLVFSATACSPQFLMKNLCFAIIHGSRIYRKSKFYNRRRGGRAQGGSPPDEGSYTDGGSYTDEESHTDEGSHTDERQNGRSEERSKHRPDEPPNRPPHEPSTSLHLKESHVNKELLSRSYLSIDTINIRGIKNAEYNRVDSLSYDKISPQVYLHYLKYNGVNFKRYMSCYVDQIEKNSTGYSLIFLFFFILIATKIAILVVTYTMDFDQDLNRHLYDLTYLWDINAVKSCWILRINCFIIFVYSFCSFLLYVVTCSLFDGVFMCLLYAFNLMSFFLVLLIMSKHNPSYHLLDYFNRNKNTLVVLFLFGYLAYLFLADTYMFIYMLLGRKYVTYRRRVKTHRGGEASGRAAHTAQTAHTAYTAYTAYTAHTAEKEEVLTPISVVSSFTLKLIKHMKGPIMLNRIIISKNLIKNTRVDNFLFFCHLKEIAIKLVLYLFACFLSLREDAINLCFALFVFMANVLLSAAYLVLSKVDRDVAMDSIFTQALFLDLTRATRDGRGARRAGTSKSQQEKDAFHEPTAHTSVYEEYSYEYAVLFENCLNYF